MHKRRHKPFTVYYMVKQTSKGPSRVRAIKESKREELEKQGYEVESFRVVN